MKDRYRTPKWLGAVANVYVDAGLSVVHWTLSANGLFFIEPYRPFQPSIRLS